MKTAVVIGAGPAGLSAAYELLSKGDGAWRVVIVEATQAIGGISRTIEHHGNRFDIGPHRFFSKSDDAFVEYCIGELKSAGIFDNAVAVYDCVHTRTKKAYPAYFGAYAEFGKVRAWLDGFENLYCIGRNGQHRYNMDHSMLCGMEAARALLGLSDKAALWDVNTEKEYHEAK